VCTLKLPLEPSESLDDPERKKRKREMERQMGERRRLTFCKTALQRKYLACWEILKSETPRCATSEVKGKKNEESEA